MMCSQRLIFCDVAVVGIGRGGILILYLDRLAILILKHYLLEFVRFKLRSLHKVVSSIRYKIYMCCFFLSLRFTIEYHNSFLTRCSLASFLLPKILSTKKSWKSCAFLAPL